MNTKQSTNELVIDFLERFRRIRSKCNVQFVELKYATITIENMIAHLEERLLTKDCVDLAHLAVKAARTEQFMNWEDHRKSHRGARNP